jgi:hypothetical protein
VAKLADGSLVVATWSDLDGATGAYGDPDSEAIYIYGSEANIGDAADASDCVANKTWAELTEW